MMTTAQLVKRTLLVKCYHPAKGDSLVSYEIMVNPARPLNDPWFGERARSLTRKFGQVVEWQAR
jgi:hypothetical protein